MALQTETHSPSSSSTETSSDSSDSLSLSSSPPLIIALLAVAVGVAIALVICWKRFTQRRAQPLEDYTITIEPPKIWDVWCPLPREDAAQWKCIQPLSAIPWNSTPTIPYRSFSAEALAHRLRRFRPGRLRHRPPEAPGPVPKASELARVQVALIIAMPEPPEVVPDEQKPFEYSLGLFEMS
ncbi:hypothetical protein C8F01DRAFT_1250674 [Mycena amicta]|nr:hypothetical protein C8F01DRAFT_1250674 [Mycena amicta]